MFAIRSVGAALITALSLASAQAEPPHATPVDAPPAKRRRWYGWQVAAADAPAWVAAWKYQPATFTLIGTGPIVHLLHGEDERAQASLAVRLAGAVVGAGITGLALFDRECDIGMTCPPDGRVILKGAAVGLMAAEVIDVVFFAWTSTADGKDALPGLGEKPSKSTSTTPRGSLLVGDGSVILTVGGAF